MTKQERIAIVRIISDLIKADTVIDVDKMKLYEQFRNKYRITEDVERAASEMSLSTALRSLVQSEQKVRNVFIDDCIEMMESDGFCSPQEALLIIAIKRCLGDEISSADEIFSVHYPEVDIDEGQVLYVECAYNTEKNEEIKLHYRQIYNELSLAGFHFVHVPQVAAHYRQYKENTFRKVARFLAPQLMDSEVKTLIECLTSITTAEFCIDQLCNRLGMQSLRDSGPALLIKISNNYVAGQLFANFLKIELTDSVLSTVQILVNNYIDLISSNALTISTVKESAGYFLYHGFYKQLFDMYTMRQGVTSTLVIDPYQEKILLPEIGCEVQGLRRKEKAFYAFLVSLTKEGGVNFNAPANMKEKPAYDRRIQHLKQIYCQWYGLFGGDRNRVPNIENPEIRNPMVSVIRKSISQLKTRLCNVEDYSIRKDEFGNYTIPLDSSLISTKLK